MQQVSSVDRNTLAQRLAAVVPARRPYQKQESSIDGTSPPHVHECVRRAAPLKLKCRRVDAQRLLSCLSVVPARWSVGGRRGDGRTNRAPTTGELFLLPSLSHAAGEIPSAPPRPAAWSVRPVWTRCSIHVCVCVLLLFLFWTCSGRVPVCAKGGGGLGARFALAYHRSAACIWSWSCCGCLFAEPAQSTSSFPFPEPAVQTGVDMMLPWKEGCSQRPWGRPREGGAVLDERGTGRQQYDLTPFMHITAQQQWQQQRLSRVTCRCTAYRPSVGFLLSSLTATDPWIG